LWRQYPLNSQNIPKQLTLWYIVDNYMGFMGLTGCFWVNIMLIKYKL